MAVTNSQEVEVANLRKQEVIEPADSAFDPEIDQAPEPTRTNPKVTLENLATKHVHPRGLVRRALSLHATQAQIDATDTDSLDDWVEARTAQLAQEREQNARARAVNEYLERKPAAPVAQEDELPGDADMKELLDAGFEPRIVKLLKRVPELVKQNKELLEREGKRSETEKQSRQQQLHDAYDSAFEALNDPRYGEGAGAEMPAASDALQLRTKVLLAAQIDVAKDSPAVIARKIKATHRAFYPETKKEAKVEPEAGYAPIKPLKAKVPLNPNGKPRITPEQMEEAALVTPTPRGRKEERSKEKAVREVAKQMVEQGYTDDDFAFEEDGLPE